MTRDDPQVGLLHEAGTGRTTLLVSFGGLNFSEGLPPFEFFNTLSDVDVDKAFVRDIDQCFYQQGVRGLGRSIPEVRARLGEVVADRERVVFLGASAGGYAALLFGAMLQVDDVVAMSPPTFIGPRRRRLYKDSRFGKRIEAAHRNAVTRKYFDVKPAIRHNRGTTRFHVYYPSGHVLDSRHARRLKDIAGVELHAIDSADHMFVRSMRDDGSLKRILTGLLDDG